jgi:preprotein translocase subunit YajC
MRIDGEMGGSWLLLGQEGDVLGAPGSGAGPAAPTATGEGAEGAAPGGAAGGPGGAGGFDLLFPLLIGLMLFMVISTMLSGRKEKKRRASMMAGIGRHDKVQTIGGIVGTVSEVRDTEVVVTVDRSSNTRITFAKTAVQQVLKQGRGGDSGREEPDILDDDAPADADAVDAMQTAQPLGR